MKQVLALCLLASCSSVAVDDGAPETASKFSIALPPRYAHWRDIFEKQFNDLRASQSDFLERWTEVDSGPLHLVLLESPLAAQKYYLANNRSGWAIALNSIALLLGSHINIVLCSPASPLNRVRGSTINS